MKKSGKRILKRIFWIFTLLLVLLVAGGVSLAYIYEDEVKQYVVEQINKQSKTKIKVEKIELSFLRRFPMAALEFKNVEVAEALESGTAGNLLQAENIFLKFNVIDLIQNRMVLKNVEIVGAKLNLVVFENGSDNFHVFEVADTGKSNLLLELNRVSLHKSELHYSNYASKQYLDLKINKILLSGKFSEAGFDINVSGNTLIRQYNSEDYLMLSNKTLALDVDFGLDTQSGSYIVRRGNISYDGIPLAASGTLRKAKQGVYLDLKMKSGTLTIKHLLNSLPDSYKQSFSDYRLSGNISINAGVKGLAVARSVPHINIDVAVHDAGITHKPTGTELDQLNLKVHYSNGKKNSLHSSQIRVDDFRFRMKSGSFRGKLLLSDFLNTRFQLQLDADLNMDELFAFTGKLYGIQKLSGKAGAQLKMEGRIKGLVGAKPMELLAYDYRANLNMNGLSLKHKASNVFYENMQGNVRINKQAIVIEPTTLTVDGHKQEVRAEIANYMAWAQDPEHNKLRIRAVTNISRLSYSDIERIIGDSEGGDGTFPKYLDLHIDFKADTFLWQEMLARDARGVFSIRDQIMNFRNVSFKGFGGQISGSCSINNSRADKRPIVAKGKLQQVNIHRLFADFHNFDQDIITSKNIKGKLTSDFVFNAWFDRHWNMPEESIILESEVHITGGELNNIQELEALSNYTRIKDFSHIEFSELHNSIQIKDRKIMIPDMTVQSNKLDLDVAGTHDFDNAYDYHISVLMSDVLFKKAKENNQNEFGEVQSDGYGNTRLFFHVYGKGEDFHVKYDRKSVAKKLKSDLKEEGESLKSVLNEEFGWFKKSQEAAADSSKTDEQRQKEQEKAQLKKQEEGQFIFEWDDEEEEEEQDPPE